MQDFMILIETKGDHLATLSPEQQQAHVQKIGQYIGQLMEAGQLKEAQPLDMSGAIIKGKNGSFKDLPFTESKEVIVGYFLIRANSLDEAIKIGKANPIFVDTEATMEIRPIKVMEGIN